MKKINFKQKKYILPLIILPFIFVIAVPLSSLFEPEEEVVVTKNEFDTNLSNEKIVGDIKNKLDSYDEFYESRSDKRSIVDGIEQEEEELNALNSNYSEKEKRLIDSLDFIKNQNALELQMMKEKMKMQQERYVPKGYDNNQKNEELLDVLLNKNEKKQKPITPQEDDRDLKEDLDEMKKSQMSLMREQMMFLDSLEQSKDPHIKAQMKAQENLKKKKEDYKNFLEKSLTVSKTLEKGGFNTVYRTKGASFIKAVIDEDIKGYLGSRIRIRLLEDVYIGTLKIQKGTFLFAQISGFTLQRVELNIVSVMYQDEILPINLSIYDVDGMKGLYIPSSIFREITKELGTTAIQGQSLGQTDQSFYMATATKLFQSTSNALANLMRKNKAKIKYNTFLYLIDEKQQEQKSQKYK